MAPDVSGETALDAQAARPSLAAVVVLQGLLEDFRSTTAHVSPEQDLLDAACAIPGFADGFLAAAQADDRELLAALAAQAGVPAELVYLLGAYLARPFLVDALAEFTIDEHPAAAAGGRCPACGHVAALAFLMPEGGQRRLWCRFCTRHWPIVRRQCPFCGDSEHLGYFTLEGQQGRRVDFCRSCHRYLKTLLIQPVFGQDLSILADEQDLLTVDLDLSAIQEGFLSPVQFPGETSPVT